MDEIPAAPTAESIAGAITTGDCTSGSLDLMSAFFAM